MMMRRKYEIQSEEIINAHAEVYHCMRVLYKIMESKPSGWLCLSLPILTMCAFSIEGLCNYIGRKKIDYWKEFEEKVSVKSKIKILMKGNTIAWNYEPWRTINKVIEVRNSLAHPKSEIVKKQEELVLSASEHEEHSLPKGHWHTVKDMKKIREIMKNAKLAMEELCRVNNIEK
jgi:hypothetical protein